MKKEKVETLVDSFVDENGVTRHFVIAVVSSVLPTKEVIDGYENEVDFGVYKSDEFDIEHIDKVVKKLSIGCSICNVTDEFDEELGKTIAIGRAKKNKTAAMYVTELGYINTKVVRAFLKQEAEFFKANPGKYIPAYRSK